MLAKSLMRPQDRIIACELHPEEYQQLKAHFRGDKQVAIHHTDGYLGLKAFLPPVEKRGLVLIDPPYENPKEFEHLATTLPSALKRWPTGVYAIWYPIKQLKQLEQFYSTLRKKIEQEIYIIELTIYPDLPQHLNGTGMVIINPPWQFQDMVDQNMIWLWNALSINAQGAFKAYPLK